MNTDIHPTLNAEKWGRARALSLLLDFTFEPLLVEVMGLPHVNGMGHQFHMALGALGLIKPFDWTHWGAPGLTTDMVPSLDDDASWRHITRIVRSERFCEGVFDSHIRDGSLTALLRHMYIMRCTDNGRPLDIPTFNDGSVEPGIRLATVKGTTMAHSTGRHGTCREVGCSRWTIEVELSNTDRVEVCSELWHYVAATDEMYRLPKNSHPYIRAAKPTAKL